MYNIMEMVVHAPVQVIYLVLKQTFKQFSH